jgi:hypothetical protein
VSSKQSETLPTIPVHYRFIFDELTAIFPTIPGTYGLESFEAFVWSDGFVALDLPYVASGSPAAPSAYKEMHAYLTKRFADDAALQIIDAIEQHHHDARHAQLRSSIAALRRGEGSPPWTPAALADLRASDAALS